MFYDKKINCTLSCSIGRIYLFEKTKNMFINCLLVAISDVSQEPVEHEICRKIINYPGTCATINIASDMK